MPDPAPGHYQEHASLNLKIVNFSKYPELVCACRAAAFVSTELPAAPTLPAQLDDVSKLGISSPISIPKGFGELSYSQQYDHLFKSLPLDVKKAVPKPDPTAQQVGDSIETQCCLLIMHDRRSMYLTLCIY